MDKRSFASMIVKYWYLVEFLGQSDFPVQSREGRELCSRVARGETHCKQMTLYHMLSGPSKSSTAQQGGIFLDPEKALQQDSQVYSCHEVLSDEIHICLGRMERYLFAERLQQVFCQDVELTEKNHKSVCLIGLKCDEKGRYLPGSICVSPLA